MDEKLIGAGSKLQKMRHKRKMTAYKLANEAGVSMQRIQHYESKFRDINKAEAIVVYRIANVLGCDISEILEIPEESKKIEETKEQ